MGLAKSHSHTWKGQAIGEKRLLTSRISGPGRHALSGIWGGTHRYLSWGAAPSTQLPLHANVQTRLFKGLHLPRKQISSTGPGVSGLPSMLQAVKLGGSHGLSQTP